MDTVDQTDPSKPKIDIKHDWYQTEAAVVVTVLVRNAKQEDINVHFSETNFSLMLKLPSDNYTLGVNLAHKVVPEQCSYKIMQSKIEIKLKKQSGVQWTKLEGDARQIYPKPIVAQDEKAVSSGPLGYPTSNRIHRNWDAIEKDIVKELAQEVPPGEEGVNKLFQQIYGQGSDEVKRAMNKSYVESGGTVLSTNWKDISKDKVPIKPPDGLEWKKWN